MAEPFQRERLLAGELGRRPGMPVALAGELGRLRTVAARTLLPTGVIQ